MKVIESGEGAMACEGARESFGHVVLGIMLTFCHELGHLFLRWVSLSHPNFSAKPHGRDKEIW